MKIIDLDSYSWNFTSALAYLITLVFFSALCSLGQTKTLLSLCKTNCVLHVGVTISIDTICIKYL